ncbi:MAG: HD domain-containing protein [Trueperaceae bacterium]
MSRRDEAYELMTEWTASDSLRKHMLAVEAAVVAYARRYREEEDLWAATALLHDFDYERHPEPNEDGHPYVGVGHLRSMGYPEEMLQAIMGHADYTGTPRETLLARVLFACDELTGLISAAVLVRPDRDIANQTVKSLKKKFKDKAFARGVKREDVTQGAQELDVELWDHVEFVLAAMQDRAAILELDGRLAATEP